MDKNQTKSRDCYINHQVIASSHIWKIGNNKIERVLEFNSEIKNYRVISLINKITGTKYINPRYSSGEFLITRDKELWSGDSGVFEYDTYTINILPNDELKLCIMLKNKSVKLYLHYVVFPETGVIRKWIDIQNISPEQDFIIKKGLISERLAILPSIIKNLHLYWVNGHQDIGGDPNGEGQLEFGLSQPVLDSPPRNLLTQTMDYSLEEKVLGPGVQRTLTTESPQDFQNLKNRSNKDLKEPSSLHSNHMYFPWVALRDATLNEGIYLGLEWSGPWHISIEDWNGSCRITTGISKSFTHCLTPGEIISSAKIFLGVYKGDVEDAGIATQRFQKMHLVPPIPKDMPSNNLAPICRNGWSAFDIKINEELIKEQVDIAAGLGFETIVIDYGWSVSAGDRRVDKRKFPHGMEELSNYVKEKGMAFGLWVSVASLDQRSPEGILHPGWFVRNKNGEVSKEPWLKCSRACLSSEYKNFLKKDLDRIITEYNVTWLKFDQNMFFNCYAREHYHQNANDSWYYDVLAFYEVLDYLLSRHPNLMIECALSGALILDFGIIQRTVTAWLSDCHYSWIVRHNTQGITYPLMPRYAFGWATNPGVNWDPTMKDLKSISSSKTLSSYFDYLYRSAMMGAYGVSEDLTKLSPVAKKCLQRSIQIYKEKRRIIHSPAYHILPQAKDPREWDAIEFFDEKLNKGVVFVFRPASVEKSIRLKLAHLNPEDSYNIISENVNHCLGNYTGEELMSKGVRVRLDLTCSSDILYINPIKAKNNPKRYSMNSKDGM